MKMKEKININQGARKNVEIFQSDGSKNKNLSESESKNKRRSITF